MLHPISMHNIIQNILLLIYAYMYMYMGKSDCVI